MRIALRAVNLLLRALVLLILQCGKLNHLLEVLLQVVHLQLESVAIQVHFQDLQINGGTHSETSSC